jgi:hypothetical protein
MIISCKVSWGAIKWHMDCQEFMLNAKNDTKCLLLSVSHPNRCYNETIIHHCDIFQDVLVTLDD